METSRDVSRKQQEEVLANALEIFVRRSSVRGDLWAKYDEKDALAHIEDKAARLRAGMMIKDARAELGESLDIDELHAALIDDALDLCNYAVFFVRHLRGLKPPE